MRSAKEYCPGGEAWSGTFIIALIQLFPYLGGLPSILSFLGFERRVVGRLISAVVFNDTMLDVLKDG